MVVCIYLLFGRRTQHKLARILFTSFCFFKSTLIYIYQISTFMYREKHGYIFIVKGGALAGHKKVTRRRFVCCMRYPHDHYGIFLHLSSKLLFGFKFSTFLSNLKKVMKKILWHQPFDSIYFVYPGLH